VVINDTPIYDHTRALALGEGFDPESDVDYPASEPDSPAAKRLTSRVWNRICRDASKVDWSNPDASLG